MRMRRWMSVMVLNIRLGIISGVFILNSELANDIAGICANIELSYCIGNL